MVEKNRKLKEQFAAAAAKAEHAEGSGDGAKPPVFRGLTFWMTGRTCIPDQELKRLIVEHCGVYEQYGYTRVTHIIADNLASGNQTWRELRKRTKRGHVVASSWVVDCVREGRRIPEARYLPKCLAESSTILSFVDGGRGQAQRPTGSASSGAGLVASAGIGASSEGAPVEVRKRPRSPDSQADTPTASGPIAELTAPAAVEEDVEPMQTVALEPSSSSTTEARVRPRSRITEAQAEPALVSTAPPGPPAAPVSAAAVNTRPVARQAASPLALEVSRSYSSGLSSASGLSTVIGELVRAMASQLQSIGCRATSAGLRLLVEPLEEWSGSADLEPAVTRSADQLSGLGPTDVATLVTVFDALARRAAMVLCTDGPKSSWARLRRVTVQLRCHRDPAVSQAAPHVVPAVAPAPALLPVLSPRLPRVDQCPSPPSTSRCPELTVDSAVAEKGDPALPGPSSPVVVTTSREGTPMASSSPEGGCLCLTSGLPAPPASSGQRPVKATCSDTAGSPAHPSSVAARSRKVPRWRKMALVRPAAADQHPEERSSASRGCQSHGGSSSSTALPDVVGHPAAEPAAPAQVKAQARAVEQAVTGAAALAAAQARAQAAEEAVAQAREQARAEAAQAEAVQTTAEAAARAETLRSHGGSCCWQPGALRQMLRTRLELSRPEAFDLHAAAVKVLLGRREFDVAVAALRALRSAVASAAEPGGWDGEAALPQRFNAFLAEARSALAAAAGGACVDVTPLAREAVTGAGAACASEEATDGSETCGLAGTES